MVGVYCDDGTHWKRTRQVGWLLRVGSASDFDQGGHGAIWANDQASNASIEMTVVKADGSVLAANSAPRTLVEAALRDPAARRRFRLWCRWCGDDSVVVVKGDRLDRVLDELADTPMVMTPLAQLAAKVDRTDV